MTAHMVEHPHDKHAKRALERYLVRRRKLLQYMMRKDYNNYRYACMPVPLFVPCWSELTRAASMPGFVFGALYGPCVVVCVCVCVRVCVCTASSCVSWDFARHPCSTRSTPPSTWTVCDRPTRTSTSVAAASETRLAEATRAIRLMACRAWLLAAPRHKHSPKWECWVQTVLHGSVCCGAFVQRGVREERRVRRGKNSSSSNKLLYSNPTQHTLLSHATRPRFSHVLLAARRQAHKPAHLSRRLRPVAPSSHRHWHHPCTEVSVGEGHESVSVVDSVVKSFSSAALVPHQVQLRRSHELLQHVHHDLLLSKTKAVLHQVLERRGQNRLCGGAYHNPPEKSQRTQRYSTSQQHMHTRRHHQHLAEIERDWGGGGGGGGTRKTHLP